MRAGSTIARNILATMGTQFFSWMLAMVVALYLPRYLGEVGLGRLAFATSLITILAALIPLGTSGMIIKEVARERSRTSELVVNALLLRLPFGAILLGAAVMAVRLLRIPEETYWVVVWGGAAALAGTINDVLVSALQGQERIARQSFTALLEKIVASVITLAMVFWKAPLWAFAAAGLITSAFSIVANFRALLPDLRHCVRPTLERARWLFYGGIPFLGWSLFRTLYGYTDPLVLGLLTNDATVGWYAVAFRLLGTTVFFPTALSTALLPTLLRLYTSDREAYVQLVRRTLSLTMLLAIPFATLLIGGARELMALLGYTGGFGPAVPVLQIGGVGVLLYFAAIMLGTAALAADGERAMARSSMVATILGIPLCALFTLVGHRYFGNGAAGAMASDLIVEMYLISRYIAFIPAETLNRELLVSLGRCFGAATPGVLIFLAFNSISMGVAGLAAAAVAYALITLRLGCLDKAAYSLLRSIVQSRTQPAVAGGSSTNTP